jgi:hypothetical protein
MAGGLRAGERGGFLAHGIAVYREIADVCNSTRNLCRLTQDATMEQLADKGWNATPLPTIKQDRAEDLL